MGRYIINGGKPLFGKVKIESAKNSVLPLLAGSILTNEKVIIKNCPKIKDVISMIKILNLIGVKTEFFDHAFQTNHSEVQYFDRLYEARDVVATGLKDLYQTKKDVSIHGFPVKAQVLMVKLLPHKLVMSIWQNQQKKPKNNKGLTTK